MSPNLGIPKSLAEKMINEERRYSGLLNAYRTFSSYLNQSAVLRNIPNWRSDAFRSIEKFVGTSNSYLEYNAAHNLAVEAEKAAKRFRFSDETMDSLSAIPLKNIVKDLNSIQDSWKTTIKYAEATKSIIEDANRQAEATRSLLERVALQHDTWSLFNRASINKIIGGFGGIEAVRSLTDLSKSISKMYNSFDSLPGDEIVIDADAQSATVSGNVYAKEQIRGIIEETLEQSGFVKGAVLTQDNFEQLINEVRKIKEPFLQKVIWQVIIPLIVGIILIFIQPQIQYYSTQVFAKNKAVATKKIMREIPLLVPDRQVLKNLRFVTAHSLNVREQSAKASKKIGVLGFGDLVIVIEKRRNWALIEWVSRDQQVSVRGWVFSRYLKQFNKARRGAEPIPAK